MLHSTGYTLCALAVLASGAAAQSDRSGSVGLGIALNPIARGDLDGQYTLLPVGLGNFTVPIWVGEKARVEPELGVLRASSEFSGNGFSSESRQTLLRYGIAIHFLLTRSDTFQSYIGPRVGFVRRSMWQKSSGTPADEGKRTDNYVGVGVGGEHWFSSHVSLGAEVQINRLGLGDEQGTSPSSSEVSSSVVSNNGVIALRVYF